MINHAAKQPNEFIRRREDRRTQQSQEIRFETEVEIFFQRKNDEFFEMVTLASASSGSPFSIAAKARSVDSYRVTLWPNGVFGSISAASSSAVKSRIGSSGSVFFLSWDL